MKVIDELKKNGINFIDINSLHIFINTKEIKYDRLKDSLEDLIENIKDIEYDEDYGGQELFGLILMNDNSWFERGEYDGAEWWQHKRQITKYDVFNFDLQ